MQTPLMQISETPDGLISIGPHYYTTQLVRQKSPEIVMFVATDMRVTFDEAQAYLEEARKLCIPALPTS